jgi:hypothetical protein
MGPPDSTLTSCARSFAATREQRQDAPMAQIGAPAAGIKPLQR